MLNFQFSNKSYHYSYIVYPSSTIAAFGTGLATISTGDADFVSSVANLEAAIHSVINNPQTSARGMNLSNFFTRTIQYRMLIFFYSNLYILLGIPLSEAINLATVTSTLAEGNSEISQGNTVIYNTNESQLLTLQNNPQSMHLYYLYIFKILFFKINVIFCK